MSPELLVPALAGGAALLLGLALAGLSRPASRAGRVARAAQGRRPPPRTRRERAMLGKGLWRAVSGWGVLRSSGSRWCATSCTNVLSICAGAARLTKISLRPGL